MRLWRKVGLAACVFGGFLAFAGAGDLQNSWLGKYAAEPGARLDGYAGQSIHGNAVLPPQSEVMASYAMFGLAALCVLLGALLWPRIAKSLALDKQTPISREPR